MDSLENSEIWSCEKFCKEKILTYLIRNETKQPYKVGLYIFPTWLAMKREGFVFCVKNSWLDFMKADSTCLSKYESSNFTSLQNKQ